MRNIYSLLNPYPLDPKKVKILLIQREKSVNDLAEELGILQPTISRYVNGHRRNPKIQEAIAKALGVRLETILLKSTTSGGRYDTSKRAA